MAKKIRITVLISPDMRARINTYARLQKKSLKSISDAVGDCLELCLGQGSDFDDKLQNNESYMRTYNDERKRYGLKPLKHSLLNAQLSTMLTENGFEEIVDALKELQK